MNNPIDGSRDRAEETRSPSFLRLFGQMVMLPFTVFVQGMELFIKTIQGMQRAADEGMNVMVGETAETPKALGGQGHLAGNTTSSVTDGTTKDGAAIILKEERKMDQDLSGEDTLKLVRYKIMFVKRDYEVAFDEKEDLVSYSTTAPDWAALQISHFMGDLRRIKRPEKWRDKNYPPGVTGEFIDRIPDGDQKYVRIYFEILQRWEREEAEYEKQQVEVLREIRDRIGHVSAKAG
jgi:hypothetical protein